ncbi:Hypothetical_protein [Hexamita inflata]|uniref:Hypothetical_protein n=1 Tax=Hexamita inflata TaxID=28002 RepID=A0AA86RNL2_9EUKA|nr:Hypothetical protein HINF_LOCUS57430 [Hexamita inflata]
MESKYIVKNIKGWHNQRIKQNIKIEFGNRYIIYSDYISHYKTINPPPTTPKLRPQVLIMLTKQCIKGNHQSIPTNQPLVQTEGNNEQIETEKREPVSGNEVSESGKTPLTTP